LYHVIVVSPAAHL